MNSEIIALKEKAKEGNPEAQYKIGAMLIEGKVVKKNSQEGCRWLESAAKHGDINAQMLLADQYSKGEGVPQNNEIAMSWYKKASERGHADALHKMGLMMIYSKRDNDSISTGEGLIRDSAQKENVNAQYELGMLYLRGSETIKVDYEEATRWLKKAAEKDHLLAINELGYIYSKNSPDKKIKMNEKESMKYWQIAAGKGLAEAEYNLAILYIKLATRLLEDSSGKGFNKSTYMLNIIKNEDLKN